MNRLKEKKYIISTDAEKGYDKIKHPFMTKAPKKVALE
jgi:hypothetical protein